MKLTYAQYLSNFLEAVEKYNQISFYENPGRPSREREQAALLLLQATSNFCDHSRKRKYKGKVPWHGIKGITVFKKANLAVEFAQRFMTDKLVLASKNLNPDIRNSQLFILTGEI